jgi:hypothetical protein
MIDDTNHWQNLKPPLSPNPYEVELFKFHINQLHPVCLLGMTKELIPLCDFMVDLNPIPQNKPVIQSDWKQLDQKSSVIIGDGILNLSTLDIIDHLLELTTKIVCRVFLKKLEGMKYAQHFPKEFAGAELVIPTQKDVVMVIWNKASNNGI